MSASTPHSPGTWARSWNAARCAPSRVKTSGWRSILIAGAHDPIFIAQIDTTLAGVLAGTRAYFAEMPPETYQRCASNMARILP